IIRSGCASTNDFQLLKPARGRVIRCEWQTATARASVASKNFGVVFNFKRLLIIYWTCSFDAAPLPTTDFLISRGEYSDTGTSKLTPARIETPRAWPIFSADCAFLL